jgi:hypothetical protein
MRLSTPHQLEKGNQICKEEQVNGLEALFLYNGCYITKTSQDFSILILV